ncbi:MFS transporter [Neoroseomonas oryzicola]|uniref:MFS transporter n=1 Tax=Neoroseomonas oryzicola TaxID=535904 RepID=A0A9X9WFT9_9PROT|nr:MFS transporter [Neoroseomonas oryzicola]MBR0659199.1 MFS transporter [Neoroseomonas oryzicola]NKE17772.1 MFS transporter [Neoroseomonas oryzicola]
MTAAQRQVVFINAAHTFTHYCLLILATAVLAMVTQERDRFGADYGPILSLGTAMFVTYGLGALPMGWLADRVGRRALMIAFFLGTGFFMAAAGFMDSPVAIGICLGLMGCFAAIYHPIGTAMLVEAAGSRVGRAMGINGVFGNFGVATAPIVTAFVAAALGWRWAFILPGVACAVVGLFYAREPEFDAVKAGGGAKPFPEIPRSVVRRAVVILLSIAAVSGLVFNAYTLLIPKLMEERLAGSPDLLPVVGLLAFLATICGGLTQFTVGRMIDSRTLKSVFLPLGVAVVPGLAALAFLDGWLVLPVAGLVAACVFGQVTVNETMTARYVAPELRAKLYSIRFTIGFLGAAIASPLIGLLHEATGSLSVAMLVLAGVATVTLVCAFAFPNRPEELRPEAWAKAPEFREGRGAAPVAAE